MQNKENSMIFKRNLVYILICLLSIPVVAGADSPGITVGYTTRDQQTVGATNNRCALDSQGGAHVGWTEGDLSNRYVYYNFIDEFNGVAFGEDGVEVNQVAGAGFPTVVANSDDAAAVAYHNFSNMALTLGIDASRGFGLFTLYDPPDNFPGGGTTFWPRVDLDINGRYHIVAVEHGMQEITVQMIYTHSTDTPDTWEPTALVDTVTVQAYTVVTSKFDDKAAIVYAKPKNLMEPTFVNNDVVYIESEDGVTWDFDNKINITNYTNDDSIRCFNNIDAVYDPDGNLHIIWTTPLFNPITQYSTPDSCMLWHWSEPTGIDMVAEGMNYSMPGSQNRSISSANISITENGDLYVTYCRFNDQDMSHGGFSNGDIYYTMSVDGGEFWLPEENLTNSESPGCMPGNCDNDFQLSTAEFVDNNLHLYYVNDKDAGMYSGGEGELTTNPLNYLRVPVTVDVDEGGNKYVPGRFYLSPAYPNPFNAQTSLGYEVSVEGHIKLDIYNIAGQVVKTLIDGHKSAGHYTVRVDASGLASGIYYARLSAGDESLTRKLTLLK
ncbi:MAG: T9SS type A sorting domain-containing protein [candidate division Zixibacteria bacterium]|nr:T9SS type A sorting domain-containing protein [candidate division Zixibacteria bacterium]